MSKYEQTVYWDSSIFIALITDDSNYTHKEKEGIRDCLLQIKQKKICMITSDIIEIEVLSGKMSKEAYSMFEKMFYRPNISKRASHSRIHHLARDIRNYYAELKKSRPTKVVGSMDAIHLATAIHYEVDAFYTFDDGGKGDKGLLRLNGNVAGYDLLICKPPPPDQGTLELK